MLRTFEAIKRSPFFNPPPTRRPSSANSAVRFFYSSPYVGEVSEGRRGSILHFEFLFFPLNARRGKILHATAKKILNSSIRRPPRAIAVIAGGCEKGKNFLTKSWNNYPSFHYLCRAVGAFRSPKGAKGLARRHFSAVCGGPRGSAQTVFFALSTSPSATLTIE